MNQPTNQKDASGSIEEMTGEEVALKTLSSDPVDASLSDVVRLVHSSKFKPEVIQWAINNAEFVNFCSTHYLSSDWGFEHPCIEAIVKNEAHFKMLMTSIKINKNTWALSRITRSALVFNPEIIISNIETYANTDNAPEIVFWLAQNKKLSKNHDSLFRLVGDYRVSVSLYLANILDASISERLEIYLKYRPVITHHNLHNHGFRYYEKDIGFEAMECIYNRFVSPDYNLKQLMADFPEKFKGGLGYLFVFDLFRLTPKKYLR